MVLAGEPLGVVRPDVSVHGGAIQHVCGKFFWYVGVCHCLPESDSLLKHCLRMVDRSTFSGKQCFSARPTSLASHCKHGTRSTYSRQEDLSHTHAPPALLLPGWRAILVGAFGWQAV